MTFELNTEINKAIIRSQHCQRNWDLSRTIPQEDMEVLVNCVAECPSKQNVAFYKAHFITNREIIEALHETTRGFDTPTGMETNPQTLANLLIVFEANNFAPELKDRKKQSVQTRDVMINGMAGASEENLKFLRRDAEVALGIAAGYLNVVASLMGYATGCCSCFDGDAVHKILNLENSPLLLMGIGYKDPNLNRRVHHKNHDFVFNSNKKQPIKVNFIQ